MISYIFSVIQKGISMERIMYTGEKPVKEIFEVFSETMEELFQEDPAVVYIDADLMSSMRTKDLWERYPQNVFNTGIQEANMVGVAGGMNLVGLKPYIHSFAPFAVRRCFDQIYVTVGYAHKSVRIIGSEPGICATDNGGTHMTFEDVALMRSIPESCVIDISDAKMFHQLLKKTKDRNGVTYFRTPRRGLPDIYASETVFEVGKGKVLRQGKDVTIISSGIMVSNALMAADALHDMGIEASVLDPVTIKPLDSELIEMFARQTNAIVTVENHNIIGGLGSAVAEIMSGSYPVPIERIGIRDRFGQVGNEVFLRNQYSLTTEEIVERVIKLINT